MKKLITLIFIFTLFLVAGCTKTPTLKEGAYYDRNNLYNGESLEWIYLKENNIIERTTCGAEAGCSLFKGTYEIKENILTIKLTHYNDEIDGWLELEEKENLEYTISDDNIFITKESVFILDDKKDDDSNKEYDVKLEKANESFKFDQLSLEFQGNKLDECEECYYYFLKTKYNGKDIDDIFYNDDENSRILSSNMAASFKVYKIGKVYLLVSNVGKQCYSNNVLIFNTEGKTLKMFANADITINGKNIDVEVSPSGNCMGEPEYKFNFEISGLELKEK